MKRPFSMVQAALAAVLFLGLVLGLILFLKYHEARKKTESIHNINNSPLYEPGDKPMKVYIKAVEMDNGRLFNLEKAIYQSKTRVNQMRQLLLVFLNGPRTGKDQVPVPEGLKLNDFYFTSQGTAVVDVSTTDITPGQFGFYEEVLFIRGLIESLSQNFFEIKQVKVLVNGNEALTLNGHYALGTGDLGSLAAQSGSVLN